MQETMRDLPSRVSKADWGDLFVLLNVAQAGSFRKAAESMAWTQATVSRRIDALEARLGVTFFQRKPSGVTLTEAGEKAVDYAISMARTAWDLEDELAQLDREVIGEVAISSMEVLALSFLAPNIKLLQRTHPKLSVRLLTRSPAVEPSSGGCDIAIQCNPAKNMDSVGVKLGTLHYCFFAAREYFDLYGPIRSPEDMLNHRVIFQEQFDNYDNSWPKELEHLNQLVKFCMKTDSGTCLLQAAASGAALTVMPSFMGAYDRRLVMADMPPLASLRFWLVYRDAERNVGRIKTTIDWIKNIFDRGTNPWFRDEFVHPSEFGDAARTIAPAVMSA